MADREILGVPYIKRPWCGHSDMGFWLGFAPLAFGSVKNLYHKAVVYNSAWQGHQTPWGTAIPEVLQHLRYCNTSIPAQSSHSWYQIKLIYRIALTESTWPLWSEVPKQICMICTLEWFVIPAEVSESDWSFPQKKEIQAGERPEWYNRLVLVLTNVALCEERDCKWRSG